MGSRFLKILVQLGWPALRVWREDDDADGVDGLPLQTVDSQSQVIVTR
jgi:hypothetical protein